MRNYLDTNKIDYVIAHLKLRCNFSDELNQRFLFSKSADLEDIAKDCFIFPLTDKEKALDYKINELPIFYPVLAGINQHTISKNGSAIFSHDILQQIFCLQTLYYEQEVTAKDKLGRIKLEETLNYKLGILDKPIVDYLFVIIIDALEEFCSLQNIFFERKDLLPNHTFLLSHDVDRIETYSFYNTLNSVKKLFIKPNNTTLKAVKKNITQYSRFSNKDNPLWDFPLMREVEDKYNLKSTYYFLNRGKLHQDAYYTFSSPKILKLINEIKSDQNEIGLHLTIDANKNEEVLKQNLNQLNSVLPDKVIGTRSHWLRFEPTITPDLLSNLNIKYDTSIGHYSREGFRAGTCLPYKLFSFKHNKMLDIWEIPLLYMDCMILDYQNISEQEALEKLNLILKEVIKFKGVFTLLWHNGNFANSLPYDRYNFFIKLIDIILESQPTNITAKELITNISKGN